MKFYLVKNERIWFSQGGDKTVEHPDLKGDLYYRYQMVATSVLPISNTNQVEVIKCTKLRSMLEDYSKSAMPLNGPYREMQTWNADLLVGVSETLNVGGTNFKGYISLEGLFAGNSLEGLRELSDGDAKVQIEFVTDSGNGATCQLSTIEMNINDSKCSDYNMRFPLLHFMDFRSAVLDAVFSISVTIPDQVLEGNYKRQKVAPINPPPSITQHILEEELLSDVIIIAGNDATIKAHKVFLAAKSSVFLAMFQTDMTEARECTVEMPDMMEESVRAFLKYLYYDDIESPDENSLVAFELFNAGHKYNISSLESSMRELLSSKPNEWYDVDVGVRLFLFARNMAPVDENLKVKAIQVLRKFADKLEESPTYMDLFKKDAGAAMELCKYALTTK